MNLLIACILFFPLLYAKFDKDGPNITDLALWEDKMPFEEIDGYKLIDSKELINELTKILGPKKIKEFLKVRTQSVVMGKNKDGLITFNLCHGYCGLHNFQTYVNTKTKKIYVCESIHGEETQRVWYSQKGKIEFNNLTNKNMIHCRFSNPVDQVGINWKKFLSAIPKEIL